jgi:hypothetical protein
VFDISQTEGNELPALTEVHGYVSGYRERLVKFVEAQGISLNYSERRPRAFPTVGRSLFFPAWNPPRSFRPSCNLYSY